MSVVNEESTAGSWTEKRVCYGTCDNEKTIGIYDVKKSLSQYP